jgi:S-adenosylmethionine synthetase
MGIFIDTLRTSKLSLRDGEIAKKVEAIFDMRPYFIEQRLKLSPIYSETAATWDVCQKTKNFLSRRIKKTVEVELFTWEKLDFVEPTLDCTYFFQFKRDKKTSSIEFVFLFKHSFL